VAVDDDLLLLQMIRVDGSIRDSMTLMKGAATVTTTSSTTSTTRVTTTTSSTTSTIRVTTTTSSTTTSTLPLATLHFAPVADAWVDANAPTKNFGTSTTMTADASPLRVIYLRFVVSGVGDRVVSGATLRLTVDSSSGANSASGGTAHRVPDPWQEATVTYRNRPAVDAGALASLGAVALKTVVTFDVTAAVSGDGVCSFAVDTSSKDDVRYLTREAKTGKPDLVVTLAPPPTTTTTSSTTSTSTTTSTTESTTSTTESTTSTTESTTSTTESTTSTTESTTSTTDPTSSSYPVGAPFIAPRYAAPILAASPAPSAA
jgi:hypothetical protein